MEDETIFSGLVWSGERSIGLGLADDFGTRHSVARELEAENIIDFTPETRFIDRLADRIGSSAGARISETLSGGYRLD